MLRTVGEEGSLQLGIPGSRDEPFVSDSLPDSLIGIASWRWHHFGFERKATSITKRRYSLTKERMFITLSCHSRQLGTILVPQPRVPTSALKKHHYINMVYLLSCYEKPPLFGLDRHGTDYLADYLLTAPFIHPKSSRRWENSLSREA
jgi:hypothetical protein